MEASHILQGREADGSLESVAVRVTLSHQLRVDNPMDASVLVHLLNQVVHNHLPVLRVIALRHGHELNGQGRLPSFVSLASMRRWDLATHGAHVVVVSWVKVGHSTLGWDVLTTSDPYIVGVSLLLVIVSPSVVVYLGYLGDIY